MSRFTLLLVCCMSLIGLWHLQLSIPTEDINNEKTSARTDQQNEWKEYGTSHLVKMKSQHRQHQKNDFEKMSRPPLRMVLQMQGENLDSSPHQRNRLAQKTSQEGEKPIGSANKRKNVTYDRRLTHSIPNMTIYSSISSLYDQGRQKREAVNSSSQLITQRATSNNVTLTLPSGSRCIGKFSRLCLKEADSELHCEVPDVEYIKADNLTVINRLQPNTSYILKTENETLENCSVRIHTCPDKAPMVLNLRVDVKTHSFDVVWFPPQETCQSQYNYFLRYKLNDSEYTNWTNVDAITRKNHERCLSNVCVALEEDHRGKSLCVQVRAQRVGEARWGELAAEAHARAPERQRGSGAWAPAWMSGLWAAVGAVAGLAFVTVLGVCYFDRRSKWRDAQKTWDNTTDLPARPETLDDLLAPDIDVLVDCEIAPEHTQPAAAADLPTPM